MSGQLALRIGTDSVAAHHAEWMEKATRVISLLAERGRPFTAEHVRMLAGEPPEGNLMGAAFRRAKGIRAVGFKTAERASRQGGVLREWVGQ